MRLLEHMTRDEAKAVGEHALLVLPVGAVEQHGPHLPVGTDYVAVEAVARAAAEALPDDVPVVVAPTLPFGSSHHHIPFGGTLSLSTTTYYQVLADLVESAILSGFRRIFILNGHGGNSELIQLAARDMALKHDAHLAAAPYWTIAWEALIRADVHTTALVPGHAGTFETALIMALRPELVHEPRPARNGPFRNDERGYLPFRAEHHGWWQSIDGFTDSPAAADAALGQRCFDLIVEAVRDAFAAFHASCEAS